MSKSIGDMFLNVIAVLIIILGASIPVFLVMTVITTITTPDTLYWANSYETKGHLLFLPTNDIYFNEYSCNADGSIVIKDYYYQDQIIWHRSNQEVILYKTVELPPEPPELPKCAEGKIFIR